MEANRVTNTLGRISRRVFWKEIHGLPICRGQSSYDWWARKLVDEYRSQQQQIKSRKQPFLLVGIDSAHRLLREGIHSVHISKWKLIFYFDSVPTLLHCATCYLYPGPRRQLGRPPKYKEPSLSLFYFYIPVVETLFYGRSNQTAGRARWYS